MLFLRAGTITKKVNTGTEIFHKSYENQINTALTFGAFIWVERFSLHWDEMMNSWLFIIRLVSDIYIINFFSAPFCGRHLGLFYVHW